MNLIQINIDKIIALCRKYKVKSMYAFGSVLTQKFSDESDIDLLVNFNSEIDYTNYADNILDLYAELKSVFGKDVDLVDESALQNPYFIKEIDRTKHLIYG